VRLHESEADRFIEAVRFGSFGARAQPYRGAAAFSSVAVGCVHEPPPDPATAASLVHDEAENLDVRLHDERRDHRAVDPADHLAVDHGDEYGIAVRQSPESPVHFGRIGRIPELRGETRQDRAVGRERRADADRRSGSPPTTVAPIAARAAAAADRASVSVAVGCGHVSRRASATAPA